MIQMCWVDMSGNEAQPAGRQLVHSSFRTTLVMWLPGTRLVHAAAEARCCKIPRICVCVAKSFEVEHLYSGSRRRVRLAAAPVAMAPNSSSSSGLPRWLAQRCRRQVVPLDPALDKAVVCNHAWTTLHEE